MMWLRQLILTDRKEKLLLNNESIFSEVGKRSTIIGIKKKRKVPGSEPDIWISSKEETNLLNCETCGDSFTKFCDLELHIKKRFIRCTRNTNVVNARLRKFLHSTAQKLTLDSENERQKETFLDA